MSDELREKLAEVVRGISSGPFHRPVNDTVEQLLDVFKEHEAHTHAVIRVGEGWQPHE